MRRTRSRGGAALPASPAQRLAQLTSGSAITEEDMREQLTQLRARVSNHKVYGERQGLFVCCNADAHNGAPLPLDLQLCKQLNTTVSSARSARVRMKSALDCAIVTFYSAHQLVLHLVSTKQS